VRLSVSGRFLRRARGKGAVGRAVIVLSILIVLAWAAILIAAILGFLR